MCFHDAARRAEKKRKTSVLHNQGGQVQVMDACQSPTPSSYCKELTGHTQSLQPFPHISHKQPKQPIHTHSTNDQAPDCSHVSQITFYAAKSSCFRISLPSENSLFLKGFVVKHQQTLPERQYTSAHFSEAYLPLSLLKT